MGRATPKDRVRANLKSLPYDPDSASDLEAIRSVTLSLESSRGSNTWYGWENTPYLRRTVLKNLVNRLGRRIVTIEYHSQVKCWIVHDESSRTWRRATLREIVLWKLLKIKPEAV